ncbi:MAG: hypothetical protein QOI87_1038 [Bradyrhizobium sp.]|jgi:hypothetical protein|nr:hypothetical protein [Bradyrhizobium sp.]
MSRWFSYIAAIAIIGLIHAPVQSQPAPDAIAASAMPRTTSCPAERQTVDIKASADPNVRRQQRDQLKDALAKDGTTVRLGPDVDLDFSDLPASYFPLFFGRCVTLTSVSEFRDIVVAPSVNDAGSQYQASTIERIHPGDTIFAVTEARSPRSPGPVLRYGKHRDGAATFLEIHCYADGAVNDGARISGFRLIGPDFGNQSTEEVGIRIIRCVDIEISNMEIAGWGGQGIRVDDERGADHSSETNGPGGRIINPDQIWIHNNHIHNNQHPNLGGAFCIGGHAAGYGVETGDGAWAKITRNVFDFNRHAIAASGYTGGYNAEQNLVLKGGGYHGTACNTWTHIFDVHGTGCWWSDNLCGDAGIQFWYTGNAFQYSKDNDIKIRGKPAISAVISGNIFPRDSVDDAVDLNTTDNVTIKPDNVTKFDSFGKYGVCDFDGDGVDDLFLATGTTWWFSSFGEFQWSFLNSRPQRLSDVRLGYFDDDLKCDVLAQQADGSWAFSSGGTGDWKRLGTFGFPLNEVVFGRFDPSIRDHGPNATLRTTHAFRRAPDGQWFVTPLTVNNWQPVQSSSFPMSQLRFGDFNGDGVTDVLAVENGRWAVSESARGSWLRLNATLSDPVGDLYIANMDADDNIDDILKLDRKIVPLGGSGTNMRRATLTWWRSKNGVEPWHQWKQYVFQYVQSDDTVIPGIAFVGRFGAAPGGATLVIDQNRQGYFHGDLRSGLSPDWNSLFPY